MARDHSRFRKLLQVQRHHLVNAELAVRWWAHFDVFHFYTSVPIHIAVPATDLFAIEQSRLSILVSSRDIFDHARASYDNWTFLNPGTWA